MNINDVMNNMINNNPELRSLFQSISSSQARYQYYGHKGSKDRYFYTTEKVSRNGKARYVSGIYRYIKTKRMWKAINQAGHAKRRDANARAYKLYQKVA